MFQNDIILYGSSFWEIAATRTPPRHIANFPGCVWESASGRVNVWCPGHIWAGEVSVEVGGFIMTFWNTCVCVCLSGLRRSGAAGVVRITAPQPTDCTCTWAFDAENFFQAEISAFQTFTWRPNP